jgi:hypothetical protein
VDDFSEAETRILCALTYFSLPAKVEHIAELSACQETNAEQVLRSLVNRSLVVPSEEMKTFIRCFLNQSLMASQRRVGRVQL